MAGSTPKRRDLGGWSAWGATWLSSLAASLAAVLSLALLSSDSVEETLEVALHDHLHAQAQLVAAALSPILLPGMFSSGGSRANVLEPIRELLQTMGQGGRLHDLAIFSRDRRLFMNASAKTWIAEQAEAELIQRAMAGETVTGTLYRGEDGALYLTAYAPIPHQEGVIVALEGSGATLSAVDALEDLQLQVGTGVVLLAGILGAFLARLVVQPMLSLVEELSSVRPGDDPERLSAHGSREVRGIANAARALLEAIRARDQEIQAVHQRELDQMSRMAAEVAHEVRNPLNAMALSVERIPNITNPERLTKVLVRIREQIGQLEAIVHRFVHLAKPLAPELGPVQLTSLVEDVTAEVAEQGATVRTRATEVLTVMADRVMVAEVLRNLCLNAVQAGATEVTFRLEPAETQALIRVSDNGPGIAPGDEEQIFEWFHTTRAQGSGLGLPTSRRMVNAMGGSLELLSARPVVFELRLPRETT